MIRWGRVCVVVMAGCYLGSFAVVRAGMAAQAPGVQASGGCSLELPALISGSPNIFNDRQEQDLGDAFGEYDEADMQLVAVGTDDRLTRIGERLVATLPPTGLHYRFRVYDSGEVNGFSLSGGRVYISRKLIAAVKNEDELAGVLAHEIGHISTHQMAIEFTKSLKQRLGITEVTDRADIFAKVHLFLRTPPKRSERESEEKQDAEEEKDQLAADRVGLFTVVRAGYAPESFASFLDVLTMNKGKKGNWLTDVTGNTQESSMRYRSALKLIAALPSECRGKTAGAQELAGGGTFDAWQKSVVEERGKTIAEGVEGDRPLKLDPPLRPSLWRIRFSLDGKYVLGQDDGSITLVDREKKEVLFRIDAPEANAAQFTPDSTGVVFDDDKLRVERWDIAAKKQVSAKEVVIYDGCLQTLLSPDGKTLVCANLDEQSDGGMKLRLRLIDVENGQAFYENKGFYKATSFGTWEGLWRLRNEASSGMDVAKMLISPDGKSLVVAAVTSTMAYDLEHRQPIPLGGKLKDMGQTRMTFLDSDKMFVVGDSRAAGGLYKAWVLRFPEGVPLQESQIGSQQVDGVTKGGLVIISPLQEYAEAFMDPTTGKLTAASKLTAMDAWGEYVSRETATGGLLMGKLADANAPSLTLPLGPLPRARAAAFSKDGKYLVVSMSNRAEAWDLEGSPEKGVAAGSRVTMLRPMSYLWLDAGDALFASLPKYLEHEPAEMRIGLSPVTSKDLGKLDEHGWQYHDMQLLYKPLGKDKGTDSHATLEVKKLETQKVAWTREFAHETPVCWSAEDDRMVLGWDLSNDAVRDEMKVYPGLQKEFNALTGKKRGLLLETVEAETGKPLEQVVLPEPEMTGGWNDRRRATVSGEYALARGEQNSIAVYRLADGVKVGEFFGTVVASDAGLGLIAGLNREEQMVLVEEKTGKELKRFSLGSPVLLARFVVSPSEGKMLMVLTADQVVHRLPVG